MSIIPLPPLLEPFTTVQPPLPPIMPHIEIKITEHEAQIKALIEHVATLTNAVNSLLPKVEP
jgi:hypothetical protein